MPGWNSLHSVSSIHILLQVFGIIVSLIVIAAGVTVYHFRNRRDDLVAHIERARARYAPYWRGNIAMTLHNGAIGVAVVGIALLAATAYGAHEYGARKSQLIAARHTAALTEARKQTETARKETEALRQKIAESDAGNTELLRQMLQEAEVTHLAETAALRRELEQVQARRAIASADRETEARLAAELETLTKTYDQATARHAAETAELRQAVNQSESKRIASIESLRWEVKRTETQAEAEISRLKAELSKAERRIASLQSNRRLSTEEKHALIDALAPFRGQKIAIAAISGDEDGRIFAEDFVEVFEAAGWEHDAVAFKRWDRDPVGVEITLNEADGRAGRVSTGVGALINATRKMSLVDGNTIYMNADVPAGQVLIKIGRKLQR